MRVVAVVELTLAALRGLVVLVAAVMAQLQEWRALALQILAPVVALQMQLVLLVLVVQAL
jgi:hypothetical protein